MLPAVEACTLCDWQGFLQVWDAAGVGWQIKCCHDAARMDTHCQAHGYRVERCWPYARAPDAAAPGLAEPPPPRGDP